MTLYGYARVSTDGQTVETQIEALLAAGLGRNDIYEETASGATRAARTGLRRAIAALGPGDVLMVTRLDRLARSTRDLLNILAEIADKGAGFKSLADAWADTTTPHGRLMLTILGGLAEFERELIKARVGEGRKRAKGKVHFGPNFKLTPHQRREALARREAGELLSSIAASYNVSVPTISRLTEPVEYAPARSTGSRGYER